MSAIVAANILLAIPFLVAFIGIPLWFTLNGPQAGPDHTQARAYLRTRTEFAAVVARRQAARARTSEAPAARRAAA
jgi:hypothetical protein